MAKKLKKGAKTEKSSAKGNNKTEAKASGLKLSIVQVPCTVTLLVKHNPADEHDVSNQTKAAILRTITGIPNMFVDINASGIETLSGAKGVAKEESSKKEKEEKEAPKKAKKAKPSKDDDDEDEDDDDEDEDEDDDEEDDEDDDDDDDDDDEDEDEDEDDEDEDDEDEDDEDEDDDEDDE